MIGMDRDKFDRVQVADNIPLVFRVVQCEEIYTCGIEIAGFFFQTAVAHQEFTGHIVSNAAHQDIGKGISVKSGTGIGRGGAGRLKIGGIGCALHRKSPFHVNK